MANTKSAQKCIRQMQKRTAANKHIKSRLKTLAKKVATLAQSEADAASLKEAARDFASALDKAAKKNIIHTSKADRHKKSLSKYIFAAS